MKHDSASLAVLVKQACLAELTALKPGNVSAHPASAPMLSNKLTVRDFELSAQAMAQPLCSPEDKTIGQRVLHAIRATRQQVATNTNLGIVLLCAPLVAAYQQSQAGESLQHSLMRQLQALTLEDARDVYEAIRLAAPGGMGRLSEHDVSESPAISLQQAMRLAADRDAIARAYVDGYAVVFEVGLPSLQFINDGDDDKNWAVTQCYLLLMARQEDSLVSRKWGATKARELSEVAKNILKIRDRAEMEQRLCEWDTQLKEEGVNPGTTADFTVACLLTNLLRATRCGIDSTNWQA